MGELSLRILVVDDTTVTRKCTAISLQHLGFDVDEVADGTAALEKFQVSRYDAVLMDYTLPGMSGADCAKRMREHENEQSALRTPIIAMTAHEVDHVRRVCVEAGMDDCINKLCGLEALKDTLSNWIES